jgi:hypothetical protein
MNKHGIFIDALIRLPFNIDDGLRATSRDNR